MIKEIIYIPNTRILILEKYKEMFKTNILGRIIELKETEELGTLFSIEIRQTIKDRESAKTKLEEMFQHIPKSNSMIGSLEYFIKAGIPFTLAKKQDESIQYLGLDYQDPINLETINKKSIIPCQFYLIRDKLNLTLNNYFRNISPISQSFPNQEQVSDEKSQQSNAENNRPQEFSLLLR